LNYIWDEIKIPITYDSDWKKAMEIMSAAVLDHPAYQTLLPKAEKQHQMARRKLAVKITPLEPRLYLKLTDNWIELGLVYPVEIDIRRSFRSETSQKILTRFKEEDISMASQTIAIVEFPEGRTSRN